MARWSAHHPWRAIAGWLLFVIVCLGAGIMAGGGQAATSADYRVGEAGRAEAMAAEGGLQERPLEQVLITQRDGSTLDADRAPGVMGAPARHPYRDICHASMLLARAMLPTAATG